MNTPPSLKKWLDRPWVADSSVFLLYTLLSVVFTWPLATGLAVIDRLGVLRHVNAAFSQMTGWLESDLVGHSAPFPYWPPGQFAEHQTSLNALLQGKAPTSGFELKVLRRDGSLFDARMYGSPLLSDDGEQLGWMIAMADITEPKRISEQLAAAHERFTTVLQSLDDAVSVVAPAGSDGASDELLFANRGYRTLCGTDAVGHRRLQEALATHGGGIAGEAYDGNLKRWFDVRTRQIRWVDGREVRLQIATDISDRKATDEIVRQQQEKVALTSRLMTMGEMASSLAHELNQPLTAINNYSLGGVPCGTSAPTCFRHWRKRPARLSALATSSDASANS
jgi:PAS domain S-box-containing protein